MTEIETLINTIRDSDHYIEHIYMRGGCYRFYLILKAIYPDSEPYIYQDKDHVATKIGNNLYDIRGVIDKKFECLYSPLSDKDFELAKSWSFSRTQVLQLSECPNCGEPIIYKE